MSKSMNMVGRACGLIMALQNEYAQILAKRVNEEKAKKNELRSELSSYPRFWYTYADHDIERRASSMRK